MTSEGGERRYFVDLDEDTLAFYRQQTQQSVDDIAYGHPNTNTNTNTNNEGMIGPISSVVSSSAIFLRSSSSSDSEDHSNVTNIAASAEGSPEDPNHHICYDYETEDGDHVTMDTGRVLGQGRHSRVLGGQLRSSGQAVAVAIKQCHVDEESTACGRREGCILRRLQGVPGIIKLYGLICRPEGSSFRLALILQQASHLTPPTGPACEEETSANGSASKTFSTTTTTCPSSLTPSTLLSWARDLFMALAGAHEAGIAHGDIKPHNLLLDNQGHLLVADWGTAFVAPSEEEGIVNSKEVPVPGTLSYTAPELLRPIPSMASPLVTAVAAAAADIYSAGVTLYVLTTGRDPFATISRSGVALVIAIRQGFFAAGHNPWPIHQHGVHYSDQVRLEEAIKACVQANPHARPTARQVLEMLNDPNKASMKH